MPIIECVPNFSEGRRTEVITGIIEAVRGSGPIHVLDYSSDADHNRTVLTLAGEPDAVRTAVETLVKVSIEQIDLTRHQGGHPRMGAVDVVPLVPIRGIDMKDCVSLAREIGESIAARHELPVFLYEEAATAEHRRNLAKVRKGEFEGFAEKIADPDWQPDFGPARVHPTAGCVAVGARAFLIAYNINLNTSDVDVAQRIGKAIRHSNGGLRFVKAMGVMLEDRGIAQVSINMTDFRRTPLHRVFEMVRSEAARHGVSICGSEIVGLVPEDALLQTAEFYLRLEGFEPGRVFERRLEEVTAERDGSASR